MVDPLVEKPADKTLNYQTDEAGNVYQITDRRGQVARHAFDVLNRKTRSDYLTDKTYETFGYDDFGDLTSVANDQVTYSYVYTAKHQLRSKTDYLRRNSMYTFFLHCHGRRSRPKLPGAGQVSLRREISRNVKINRDRFSPSPVQSSTKASLSGSVFPRQGRRLPSPLALSRNNGKTPEKQGLSNGRNGMAGSRDRSGLA